MTEAYLNINKVTNYILLRFIRVSNLVLLVSLFVYFADLFTGLPVQNIIIGFTILWSTLIGYEHDIIQRSAKKIMSLDWGMSILLFLSIITIFWQNRNQTINIIKGLISKTCEK